MGINWLTYLLAKKYTKDTAAQFGAVKGAPCKIKSVEDIEGGHKVTFEWKNDAGAVQETEMNVMNGATGAAGAPGAQGEKGDPGAPGTDGVSPAVTVTDIPGGHRVVITDAEHPQGQSFDVMDGAIGAHFEVGAEKWYGTYTEGGVTYQVYSKLLDIGALPSAAGSTQYPHGITGIKQILQINGFTNDGFVINAPRQNAQDNISIYQAQKSGNIVVEVGKDRSSKNGFVMLIYAKNN